MKARNLIGLQHDETDDLQETHYQPALHTKRSNAAATHGSRMVGRLECRGQKNSKMEKNTDIFLNLFSDRGAFINSTYVSSNKYVSCLCVCIHPMLCPTLGS